MSFKDDMLIRKNHIESELPKYLPQSNPYNEKLIEAMTYSLMSGGKRIRAIFMEESFKIFGKEEDSALVIPFYVAIEMVHTSSLIHDDLPAMDNDDLRRGLPTCHIKFGEDIAILAGDALLTHAFEVMTVAAKKRPEAKLLQAMHEIGIASGANGMIGGQVADVLNEGKPIDMECLEYIHLHKTSAIIESCFVAGAVLGGAEASAVEAFRSIGRKVGLAFQIQDDILDEFGTEEELGKPIGSDAKNNKTTYVTLKGIEASNQIVNDLLHEADELLKQYTMDHHHFLAEFIRFLGSRKS